MAANDYKVNEGDKPDDAGSSNGVPEFIRLLLVLILLHKNKRTSKSAHRKDKEQGDIEDGLGNPFEEEKVDQCDYEGYE